MASIVVKVVNESTVLSDSQVQSAVPSLQTQVRRDFAPPWGIDADVSFVPRGMNPDQSAWVLAILDNSDQANALGYHDLSSSGTPLGKVFAGSDIQLGLGWTVTASHELLEMLADPYIDLTVFVQNDNAVSGVIYAYEVCDACEADALAYNIDGTKVTDFVYPTWFESLGVGGGAQFDYQKQIAKPFQILPGGYIGVFDVTSGSGWKQLTASAKSIERGGGVRIDSRVARRMKPRKEWRRSKRRR